MASDKIGELILKLHRDESLLKGFEDGCDSAASCEQGCTNEYSPSRFQVSRDFVWREARHCVSVRVPRSLTLYWPCSDEITHLLSDRRDSDRPSR